MPFQTRTHYNKKVNVANQLYKYVSKGKCIKNDNTFFQTSRKTAAWKTYLIKKNHAFYLRLCNLVMNGCKLIPLGRTITNTIKGWKLIHNLKVVNDPAEKEIKLISDF